VTLLVEPSWRCSRKGSGCANYLMNQCLSFLPTPDETEVALKLFGVNFPNPRLTVLVTVGVSVHDSSQRHVSRSQTLKISPCILNWSPQ